MNTAGSVLLDTNVVVAYFRGDKDLHPHFVGATPLNLPWVVLGELYYGAQRAQRRQEQLAYIHDLLTYAEVLFPNHETTTTYGQVKSELAQLGKPIPDNDLWIAAMARQYDLPLATRDAHFAHVPRVTTLAW
ncbi:MAG: type II toxin-antitoxin system VapC family toxin [Bryobacterales bacterium]|nr:type II toxin-antitoxin system VapC family toxin [Bryobacterales bacterium]